MRVLYLFLSAAVLAIVSCNSDTLTGTEHDALLVDSYDITASQKTVKLIHIKGPEGTVALSGDGESTLTLGSKTTVSINRKY